MATKEEMNAWLMQLGVSAQNFLASAESTPGAGTIVRAVTGARPTASAVAPAEVNPRIHNAAKRPMTHAEEDEHFGERPAPPVTMHLDDGKPPKVKPAGKPKPLVIDMSDEENIIVSAVGSITKEPAAVGAAMNGIKTQSDVNILKLQAAIANACTDFQSFSKEKIEKLKHLEELDKMALEITKTVFVAVSGGMGAMAVESELAKEVVKTCIEITSSVIQKGAEQAIDNSSKGFEAMVDALVDKAKQSERSFKKNTDAIFNYIDPIAQGARSAEGRQKLNAKQLQFFDAFSATDPSKLDKFLERWCGVPSGERSNRIQLDMYQNMVEKFMRRYLRATNPGKGMEWAINDEDWVLAHRAAVHETNEKQKQYGYKFDN